MGAGLLNQLLKVRILSGVPTLTNIMTWNYRLYKQTYAKGTEIEEVSFTIRETYYDENGKINGYTEPVSPQSESVEGMKWVLEKMQLALNKDVIDLDADLV